MNKKSENNKSTGLQIEEEKKGYSLSKIKISRVDVIMLFPDNSRIC